MTSWALVIRSMSTLRGKQIWGVRRSRWTPYTCAEPMVGLLIGLLLAVVVFAVTGGHVLFLPLLFFLPLGGLFVHRGRRW